MMDIQKLISQFKLNFSTMPLPVKLLTWTFALTLIIAAGAHSARADVRLVFGTYSADKPTETVRKLKPVLRHLEHALTQSLGEKVVISTQISKSYDDGILQLVRGNVDFARFGPASYVIAKNRSKGIGILAMEAVNGRKTFHGVICVGANSDIEDLKQLAGRSFAFGSELSTIGRYLAQSQLLEAGITSEQLKRFAYLGRHDRVGTAVGSGKYDAGALKLSTFIKLKKNKVAIRELLRFNNTTKPWISRAGMEPKLFEVLSAALTNIKDPDMLRKIKKSGFLPGNDSDYDVIRQAMKNSSGFDS